MSTPEQMTSSSLTPDVLVQYLVATVSHLSVATAFPVRIDAAEQTMVLFLMQQFGDSSSVSAEALEQAKQEALVQKKLEQLTINGVGCFRLLGAPPPNVPPSANEDLVLGSNIATNITKQPDEKQEPHVKLVAGSSQLISVPCSDVVQWPRDELVAKLDRSSSSSSSPSKAMLLCTKYSLDDSKNMCRDGADCPRVHVADMARAKSCSAHINVVWNVPESCPWPRFDKGRMLRVKHMAMEDPSTPVPKDKYFYRSESLLRTKADVDINNNNNNNSSSSSSSSSGPLVHCFDFQNNLFCEQAEKCELVHAAQIQSCPAVFIAATPCKDAGTQTVAATTSIDGESITTVSDIDGALSPFSKPWKPDSSPPQQNQQDCSSSTSSTSHASPQQQQQHVGAPIVSASAAARGGGGGVQYARILPPGSTLPSGLVPVHQVPTTAGTSGLSGVPQHHQQHHHHAYHMQHHHQHHHHHVGSAAHLHHLHHLPHHPANIQYQQQLQAAQNAGHHHHHRVNHNWHHGRQLNPTDISAAAIATAAYQTSHQQQKCEFPHFDPEKHRQRVENVVRSAKLSGIFYGCSTPIPAPTPGITDPLLLQNVAEKQMRQEQIAVPPSGDPGEEGRLDFGATFEDVSNVTVTEHINYMYDTVDECPYERFAGGTWIKVGDVNVVRESRYSKPSNLIVGRVRSDLVLKNKVMDRLEKKKRVMHCLHFLAKGRCPLGSECQFAHVIQAKVMPPDEMTPEYNNPYSQQQHQHHQQQHPPAASHMPHHHHHHHHLHQHHHFGAGAAAMQMQMQKPPNSAGGIVRVVLAEDQPKTS